MSVRRLHDVQPESFAFTADNLAWARKTIEKYPAGKQASAVIPLLWRAQEQNEGWVSQKAIEYVADMLAMSYIRVLEVVTFYTMFQLAPVGKKAHIQVCGTTPCMLRGAEDLKRVCQNKIHHEPHHLNADGSLSWEEVECLGACVNAPVVQVWKDTYEDLTPERLAEIIDDFAAGKKPKPGPQNGRQFSAPEGGPVVLTDPSLYAGSRAFTRLEPAPPPAGETRAPEPPKPAEAKPAPAISVAEKPKVEIKPVKEVAPVKVTTPKAPAPNTAADLVKPRREAAPPAKKAPAKEAAAKKPAPAKKPKKK